MNAKKNESNKKYIARKPSLKSEEFQQVEKQEFNKANCKSVDKEIK